LVKKEGRHRQFLFLVGRFIKKIFSSETAWPNKPEIGQSETRIASGGHVY
jgi:hypothetical protein